MTAAMPFLLSRNDEVRITDNIEIFHVSSIGFSQSLACHKKDQAPNCHTSSTRSGAPLEHSGTQLSDCFFIRRPEVADGNLLLILTYLSWLFLSELVNVGAVLEHEKSQTDIPSNATRSLLRLFMLYEHIASSSDTRPPVDLTVCYV